MNTLFVSNDIIISGAKDKTLLIWDQSTFELIENITGHTDAVESVNMLNNGNIISVSGDKTIKIWKISKERIKKH